MSDRTVGEAIFEADLRIDRIMNLAHQCITDPVSDEVVEWFEDYATDDLAEALGVREFVDEHGWRTTLNEEGGWLTGWVLSVATPQLKPSEDGRSARILGWSSLVHAVHGETYDEALEKALAWAEAERQRMWPRPAAAPQGDEEARDG